MSSDMQDQYLTQYTNFVEQLKVIFPDNETQQLLDDIKNSSVDVKLSKGLAFNNSFNDENFELFLKSKLKVFSHKNPDTQTISESIFGQQLCLKNILNNQPDDVKKIIWTHLHMLYMSTEFLKSGNEQKLDRLQLLTQELYSNIPDNNDTTSDKTTKKLQDMLGVNVNEQTSELIDDIVKSFESMLLGQSANPLMGIMEVSQKISVKYADKINSGEIELDKIMSKITEKVPGMDKMMGNFMNTAKTSTPKEKIVMDENFSTANIEVGQNKPSEEGGMDISSILKMVNQMGGEGGLPDFGKMMDMVKNLNTTDGDESGEQLKQGMESFLQNNLGMDINKLTEQFDNMTKNLEKDN